MFGCLQIPLASLNLREVKKGTLLGLKHYETKYCDPFEADDQLPGEAALFDAAFVFSKLKYLWMTGGFVWSFGDGRIYDTYEGC